MTVRTQILQALQSDFNISGIKKVWKYMPNMVHIPESLYPSIYVAFGTEQRMGNYENVNVYNVPVILIVFIKSPNDLNNEGLLSQEAEAWLDKYKKDVTYNNLKQVENVSEFSYETGTPYINDVGENKGFLVIEYKLTYIGE